MQLTERKNTVKKLVYALMPVLSSAALCAVCLLLAFGVGVPQVYIGYFKNPLIFLLNWLPMLMLQLLLLCAFNRQWLAFLISGIFFASAHIGNFFMLKLRFEPFKFSDMSNISAGLEVAGNYDITPNSRIYLLIGAIIFGTVFLALLVKGGFSPKKRVLIAAVCLIAVYPLWALVYSNKTVYDEKTDNSDYVIAIWEKEIFISKGFVYPFIHSIRQGADMIPEGYDENRAAEILAGFETDSIPADRRVNIIALQLEAFSDLEELGIEGISPAVYEKFRALKSESLSGTLVPNVIGGGTINTERGFLTGSYGVLSYDEAAPSYVRYFAEQGYTTVGSHPNRCDYYNRINVNANLGFSEYWFTDNHYQELTGGEWYCDDVLLPEIFAQLRDLNAEGKTVFSFSPTLQGHSPYNNAGYDYDERLFEDASVSAATDFVLNNYLGSLKETMDYLCAEIDSIRDYSEPVVIFLYGDHRPFFTEAEVYTDCALSFDMAEGDDFIRYYATPYMIWANEAAKELIGHDFVGELPTVSPGYMMNQLFEALGYEGDAYMKFTGSVMERLPVVSTKGGYIENGVFSSALSAEGQELLRSYEWVQYYYRNSLS